MDPIQSNTDRLIWLLRQRLLERAKTGKPAGAAKARTPERPRGGLEGVQALAAVEGLDDRALKRALIQNLLAEQLGEELVNEARFQQVVAKVTDTLEADEAGRTLLAQIARELRGQGRG